MKPFTSGQSALAFIGDIRGEGGLVREKAGLCFEPAVSILQVHREDDLYKGPCAPCQPRNGLLVLCIGVVDA
jgi:hypothetical protein